MDEDDRKALRLIAAFMPVLGESKTYLKLQLALAALPLKQDEYRYITGPFVIHREPGFQNEDAFQNLEWMRPQAIAERLLIFAGDLPGHIVSPTELTLAMHPATLQAPLVTEDCHVYLWAGAHARARRNQTTYTAELERIFKREDNGNSLSHMLMRCSDDVVLSTDKSEGRAYYDLAHRLRRRVVANNQHERYEPMEWPD